MNTIRNAAAQPASGNYSQNNAWPHTPTGNYAADCATGRALARDLLASPQGVIASTLPNIAAAIVAKGQHSGIEIGFWSTVGIAAASGTQS